MQQLATQTENDFNAAVSKYDADLKAYNDKVAYIGQLEAAYNAELVGAGKGVEELNAKLADAKKEAEELKVAADAARNNLNQNAQNMLEIDRLITANNTDEGTNWQQTDGLRETFKKVMVYYYLPNMGGLTDEEKEVIANLKPEDVKTVAGKNAKGGTDDTKTYHYVMVNGKKLCFNYKLLNGKKGTEIVIFEKRGVEIDDSDVAFDEFEEYKNEAGKKVDVANESVVAADSDGNGENDLLVQTNGEGTTETLISVGQDIDENKDDDIQIRVTNLGEEEVSYAYNENGDLVKTVKKGVTTVTYVKKSENVTVESKKILNKEEAQQALETQLKTLLGEGAVYDSVAVGDVAAIEAWEATGSYKPVFKDKVAISAEFDEGFDLFTPKADIREEMEGVSAGLLNTALSNKGQTLVGNPEYQVVDSDELKILGNVIYHYDYTTYVDWKPAKPYDGKLFSYWSAKREAEYQYTDNNIGTVTVTGEGATKEAAESEAKSKVNNYKQNYALAVDIQKLTTSEASLKNVGYSALVTFWQQVANSNVEKDEIVSKTTFTDENTSKLTGSMIQNKIYYDYVEKNEDHESVMTLFDENTKFTSDNDKQKHTVEAKDWGLNQALTDAKALKAKYDALYTKADDAYKKYDAAAAAVTALSTEIDKIPKRNTELFTINIDALSSMELAELIPYLEGQLSGYNENENLYEEGNTTKDIANQKELINSLRSLLAAAKNLQGVRTELGNAQTALGATVARLTPPANVPGAGGEGGTTTTTTTTTTTIAAGIPLTFAAAPGTGIAGIGAGAATLGTGMIGAGAGITGGAGEAAGDLDMTADEALTEIADAEVPRGITEDEAQDIINELKDIEDKKVPLAEKIDRETVGWWWWLLILAFGAAAVEVYRRYQNKKTQKVETTQKDDNK